MADLPPASVHLTFSGPVTPEIGAVRGPNLLGEFLTVVSGEYDTATDKTRIGYAYGVSEVAR